MFLFSGISCIDGQQEYARIYEKLSNYDNLTFYFLEFIDLLKCLSMYICIYKYVCGTLSLLKL